MGAKLGLVGLPNAGKSTLFNALTRGHAQVAPYPFTTTDKNVGVAQVRDLRLERLAGVVPHDRIIPTTLEFVDLAGLVQGAHKGEGLGNQFLSHLVAVNALLHVVRCFEDSTLPHVMNRIDPMHDVEVVKTELMLKDLEIIERRLEKDRKLAKGGDKHALARVDILQRWKHVLEQGKSLRALPEDETVEGLDLLSRKPVIYVANVDEPSVNAPPESVERLSRMASEEGAACVTVCAKLEAELVELDPADQTVMRRELGLAESVLPLIVRTGYQLLRLVTFLTTASRIIQAWTVREHTKATQAAGVIHTDFEQQFIRAEVISVDTLVACGGEPQARAKGLLRLEGKDYLVQDGDVIHFRVGPR